MPPDDKLIIETPEQTALEFSLAGIGSRGLAVAIDTLLQAVGWLALGLLAAWINSAGFVPQVGKQWGFAVLTIAAFLVEFGYFAFFEAIWNGQTPGKRWTHLRVIEDSGRPIGVQQAILRNLLRIVDFLPAFYTIGIVTSFFSAQNKRLGDYLAGTVVVRQQPLEEGSAFWSATPASTIPAIAQVAALTPAEFQLIEAFLERRASLRPEVRSAIAHAVADKIAQRCSIPAEAYPDSEQFLEYLVEQSRGASRFAVMPQAGTGGPR